ncbi:MAG: alpha/beta hydrolase fold domain-containing protein [Comamonadaceae bacterium]
MCFPGALEDNYAALSWVFDHADELGIDRRRIAIGGHSAGGGARGDRDCSAGLSRL